MASTPLPIRVPADLMERITPLVGAEPHHLAPNRNAAMVELMRRGLNGGYSSERMKNLAAAIPHVSTRVVSDEVGMGQAAAAGDVVGFVVKTPWPNRSKPGDRLKKGGK